MENKNYILIGLLLSAVFLAVMCFVQRKNDHPKIFYKKKLFNNYNGFNIPPFGIFIKESEKDNQALLDHELIHWKQFQREGLLGFLVGYSTHAICNGYDENPYEIEARTVENEYCKHHYTECVRNGTAKTVYNPNFRI